MRRYKRIIGDAFESLHDGRRTTEVAIAVKSLNRMNELGCRFTRDRKEVGGQAACRNVLSLGHVHSTG